jgi:signal transduction histidine kinase
MPESGEKPTASDLPPRKRTALPLRLRLTLWVVVVFSIMHWSSVGVFWLYRQSSTETIFDRGIQLRALALAERVGPLLPQIDRQHVDEIAVAELRHSQLRPYIVDVFDASEQPIIQRNVHLDPAHVGVSEALATGAAVLRRLDLGLLRDIDPSVSRARVVAHPMRGGDGHRYVLVLAAGSLMARHMGAQVAWVMLMTGVVGTVAAAMSGWIISGVAVAPLERARRLAATLRPESLTESIEVAGSNDEVSRLAQELDDARARLRERFEAQERFLSNVSHELKTPISVLYTEAQTLDRSGVPDHALGFIDSARDEMSRLGHLVESFLTLTRIEDGKGLARFRRFGVNDLIMSSLSNNRMMAEQHRARLVVTILPEEELDAAIAGEPGLLSTMLDNIIRNAIRFSPESGRVEIASVRQGDLVHITVRDEGPGIPPDRLPTIFDRFAQAHASERRGRGHGLGLAIAKGIAELHRGTITARNLEYQGCEFVITLPVATSTGADSRMRADDAGPGSTPDPAAPTEP